MANDKDDHVTTVIPGKRLLAQEDCAVAQYFALDTLVDL